MDRDGYSRELLSPVEHRLVSLCRVINETPLVKRVQTAFLTSVGRWWVRACTRNLLDVGGMENAHALNPNGGVLLCSNHRSFFDMYVISSALQYSGVPWFRDQYFPVRTEFFYSRWAGLAVNLIMSGGAMYPPIFRDRERASLNKVSVDRVVRFLQNDGVVVGTHPEGTRCKDPDPLAVLRAQPGVGQMALQADVPVLPIWIQGLSNNLPQQISLNFRGGDRATDPILIRVGSAVDLSDLRAQTPRLALYKRAADRIMERIAQLGVEANPDRATDRRGAAMI